MREHHTIPQEILKNEDFVDRLKEVGVKNPKNYIDRQIVRIDNVFHDTLHEGAGGGRWNETFKDWFEENRNFLKKACKNKYVK